MPGPNPETPIELTIEEAKRFRRVAFAPSTPQGEALRYRIILTAHEHPDWKNQRIARELGCGDRTVRKWRRRWVDTCSLEDLPRSGRPRRFSP